MRSRVVFLLFFVAAGLVAASAIGQALVRGSLSGRVTANDGSPLPGVTVTAKSASLQGERTAITGESGEYILRDLPAGAYDLTYELEGMATLTATKVIEVGQTSRVDVVMSLTALEETIEVTSDAPNAMENQNISGNFDYEEINSLASPRDLDGIALLAPGVNSNTQLTGQIQVNGAFSFDKDGNLVTPDSQFVQGYTQTDPVTGAILTSGPLTNIRVSPGVLRAPFATTSFTSETNLNANTATGATFNSAIQVYDSLGAPHMATITFTKQAAVGAWSYQVTVPGAEVTGGTAGTPFPVATGTLAFGPTGQLTAVNGGAPADVAITTPTWANGAAASSLSWNIVEPNGSFTLSGFAIASATSSIRQNGAAPGTMDNIAITPDGMITASFGAGQTISIGQLALATFNNMKGLVKLGSNRYGESAAAGIPNVGTAGTGGRGTLIGSAIEQSNVDIAHEFTQMILAQRGYQANSKTITVSDELLLDTLNQSKPRAK